MKNENFDLPTFFPYQLSQLQTAVSECIAQVYLGKYSLSKQEWRVLATLNNQSPLSASQIGEQCALEKMPTSRAIKSLVEKALLIKAESQQDKRAFLLSLSDQGMQLMADLSPLIKAQEKSLLSVLNDAEIQQLNNMMSKLHQQAESMHIQGTAKSA